MSDRLIVIGAAGHAKVVVATAQAAGWEVMAAFDDDVRKHGTDVISVPIHGAIEEARDCEVRQAVLASGSNTLRARVAADLALDWLTIVHPGAWVHDTVMLGAGAVILAGVVVQPDTVLSEHVILNTSATVDHDGRIRAFAHIVPCAHLAGNVSVGEGAFVGVSAAVITGVTIGDWAVLGAGAVAVEDIPPRSTAVGVPARPMERP